jgi:V/A-type H+/Na+-transporting ATPase subunit C
MAKSLKPKNISTYHLLQSLKKKRLSSKPIKYNKVMPRIAIENLKLMTKEDIQTLVGMDLESIRCALSDTTYKDEVQKIPKTTIDPIIFEKALLENYAATWKKALNSSTGSLKLVLLAINKKNEAANIKTILRAANAELHSDDTNQFIIPVVGGLGEKKISEILTNAKSIEDVIRLLHGTDYAVPLKIAIQKCKSPDLLSLEVALDKFVYQEILRSIEELSGKDKSIAKTVLETEIMAVNIKTLLRHQNLKANKEQTRDYLIPTSFFNEKINQESIEAYDAETMFKGLLRNAVKNKNNFYKNVFNQFLNEKPLTMLRVETLLDQSALEINMQMMEKHGRYYNISFVLAFISLKWFELKNLRCIIVGSSRKTPQDQIRNFLVFPRQDKVSS